MPSNIYVQNLHQLTATDKPLELLEYKDATLAEPLRFVNDNQAITSQGKIYNPSGFFFGYPSSGDKVQPKATLVIEAVGTEIIKLIDQRMGAVGATITIKHIMQQTPDYIEFSHEFKEIGGIGINNKAISFDLEYINIINYDNVQITYNKATAEGLF